jgi:acyl-CoA reductase-like NAD-dependent aldehyde dehydrogenase
MSASRIYVEDAVAEEFMRMFAAKAAALPMGDPDDPATVVGPAINEWALAVLTRRVNEAVDLGARILTGGTPEPPCYPATVLADVPADAELAVEETFGPVVIVEPVESPQEAIIRANASPFGLSAGILTADVYRGMELAGQLQAGMVHINDQPVNDEPHMPFGGVKDSGWGRFGTTFAVDEFTQLQWRTLRDAPPDLRL